MMVLPDVVALPPLLLLQVRDVLAAVTGEAFDSLLINYYPNGKAGMR
jgi:hypothetical protein